MLDFTRYMLISTQIEVVVEVGVELGNFGTSGALYIDIGPYLSPYKAIVVGCPFT